MVSAAGKQYTLQALASITKSTSCGDSSYLVSGVDTLELAGAKDVSFLANSKYRELIDHSQAGIICIDPITPKIEGKNYLISDNPSRTFQKIVELFLITPYNYSGFQGIHSTAVIHPSSIISHGVDIGPYVVIDQGCIIGPRTRIMSHVSIGSGVHIGEDCLIHSHAVIREKTVIGNRVILQPGAILGSCGFGFTTSSKGWHSKLDQLGNVIIDDDVEIGSLTTIDRARFKATKIQENTKIDNLVQIAHNVELGPSNLIVSQTGIAGSTKTGRNVVIGGQSGIVGHIEIGSGIMIASKGGVSKSMKIPGKYAGVPVMPLADFNRQQVHLRKIAEYVKKIEELEKRLHILEKSTVLPLA